MARLPAVAAIASRCSPSRKPYGAGVSLDNEPYTGQAWPQRSIWRCAPAVAWHAAHISSAKAKSCQHFVRVNGQYVQNLNGGTEKSVSWRKLAADGYEDHEGVNQRTTRST